MVSLGQAALLKENAIYKGTVSILINIKGKLNAPKLAGNISVNNLNLKNIPSDTVLSLNPANVNLDANSSGFSGSFSVNSIKAVNPALTVFVPVISGSLNEKNIKIQNSAVYLGKNQLTVAGTVSDYMSDKISLNFNTKGALNSTLTGSINPVKSSLELLYTIPSNGTIIIPGFNKSKLVANGQLAITGSMSSPVLNGYFKVPSVEIPEIPLSIKELVTNIDGPLLNGDATITSLVSGGIKANSIRADYSMLNSVFYIKNITGSAFDGAFNGNVTYNMDNAGCAVKLSGKNFSALKAIEGAIGIKNAMTGILSFNSDLTFKGVEYKDMMSTLKGVADFEIKNGVLANLGGLKTLIRAQNVIQNSFLKSATDKAGALPLIQSASEFDYIRGKLAFGGAYANINQIKMSGPLMSYYVKGRFNLLNGTINSVILGRLSSDVVNVMGAIGDFAVQKITAVIPSLGSLTKRIANSLNVSPKGLPLSEIPPLRSNDTKYKNFKVDFNGGVESSSSAKSFKWINEVDTSALDSPPVNIKETVKSAKESVKNEVNSAREAIKQAGAKAKEQIKQETGEQVKELFKNFVNTP